MLPDSTQLSPKKNVGHWRAEKPALEKGASPEVWVKAVEEFFHDRMKTRYLEPIAAIQQGGRGIGEGFAMVSLQCALIEFLESTVEGKNYKFKGALGPHDYNKSGPLFVSFLTKREPFKEDFTEASAKDFYMLVRCGLLHEARTKGTWRIHDKNADNKIMKPGPILYRDVLQRGIIKFIADYVATVPKDTNLQAAFIRKYEHLCKSTD